MNPRSVVFVLGSADPEMPAHLFGNYVWTSARGRLERGT